MILGLSGGPFTCEDQAKTVMSFWIDYTGAEPVVNRLRKAAKDTGLFVRTKTQRKAYKTNVRMYQNLRFMSCIVAGDLNLVKLEVADACIARIEHMMQELEIKARIVKLGGID